MANLLRLPVLSPELASQRGILSPDKPMVVLKGNDRSAADIGCGNCGFVLITGLRRDAINFANAAIRCPKCTAINDLVSFVGH